MSDLRTDEQHVRLAISRSQLLKPETACSTHKESSNPLKVRIRCTLAKGQIAWNAIFELLSRRCKCHVSIQKAFDISVKELVWGEWSGITRWNWRAHAAQAIVSTFVSNVREIWAQENRQISSETLTGPTQWPRGWTIRNAFFSLEEDNSVA